jgi:hypothetical protein
LSICGSGFRLNSGVSVGELDDTASTIEAVFSITSKPGFSPVPLDTVKVFSINTSDGTFVGTGAIAKAPAKFTIGSQWAGTPAIGDVDNNGEIDVWFATDDTLYMFEMETDTTLDKQMAIGFGHVPSNRLSTGDHTPQILLADIDNDDTTEVITTHWGDGCIWAFEPNGITCRGSPCVQKAAM